MAKRSTTTVRKTSKSGAATKASMAATRATKSSRALRAEHRNKTKSVIDARPALRSQNMTVTAKLPLEMWQTVFELASVEDACSLALTCSHFYSMVSHLRFAHLHVSASILTKEGLQREKERAKWLMDRPRVCHTVRHVTLATSASATSRLTPKSKLLSHCSNVEELTLKVDRDVSEVLERSVKVNILANVVKGWTRFSKATVSLWTECSCIPGEHRIDATIFDRSAPSDGISLDIARVHPVDGRQLAICATVFRNLVGVARGDAPNPRFNFDCSTLRCNFATIVEAFAQEGLPVKLDSSTTVCCPGATDIRARLSQASNVEFAGALATRPREDYADVGRWYHDIDGEGEEEMSSPIQWPLQLTFNPFFGLGSDDGGSSPSYHVA